MTKNAHRCSLFLKTNFLITILFLGACSEPDTAVNKEKPLRPVRTLEVKAADLSRIQEFTAVVDASQRADLSFKVSGTIQNVMVKQGDEVKQGQLLARLDDKDYRIQYEDAKSSYEKAKADYDRARDLIKSKTISAADFDQLKAQYNSAAAKLAGAKNSLDYTQLKASFDGVIAKIDTDNFEEINAKQPVMALHNLDTVFLKVDVPESIMIRVEKNRQPDNVVAVFKAIPDRSFPLSFVEVATQADEVTKTFEVTLSMENPKKVTILPGMTAVVQAQGLLPDISASSFYLPANTVLQDSQGNYVWTVTPTAANKGQIQRTHVVVGDITPLGIEILSGLVSGQHVVNAGMSKVSQGMAVKFSSKS